MYHRMGAAWAEPEEAVDERSRLDRRWIRVGAPALWLVAFVTYSAVFDIPLSRAIVVPWVLAGVLAFSIAQPKQWLRGVVFDWLPFLAVLFAYDVLRGLADGLLTTHVLPQLDADQDLFGGTAPTVWLQDHLYHGAAHLRWYDYGAWGVFLTHFYATIVLAGVLWLVAREHFRRWMGMVSLLAVMGFVTYVLFPAAPPWLASETGHLPATHRIASDVFHHVPGFAPLFDSGRTLANDVAAMPSLHAGYALLVALFLWPFVPGRWRPLLALYPLAMAFSLVYMGEHYFTDVLAGWTYATIAYVAVGRFAGRRAVGPAEAALAPAA
jgi:membrane-associated phospholipid phosphatase